MSSPARQVRARQAETPRVRATPSSPRPSQPKLTVVRARKRVRRRAGVGFWVMAVVVLGGMVVGLAAVYALMAQDAFEMRELSERSAALERANGDLLLQVERDSSIWRIEAWGEDNGLVRPTSPEIIYSASAISADRVSPATRDMRTAPVRQAPLRERPSRVVTGDDG